MLGGLVSTLAYGFLKPIFDDFTKPSIEESSNPYVHTLVLQYIADLFNMQPVVVK